MLALLTSESLLKTITLSLKKWFGAHRRMVALILFATITMTFEAQAGWLDWLLPNNDGAFSCGAVNYGQTAQALAVAHHWLCTLAVYVFWTIEALGGLLVIYGALLVYIKMNTGEPGILKDIMMLVGSCLFLLGASYFFPAVFGYNYSGIQI